MDMDKIIQEKASNMAKYFARRYPFLYYYLEDIESNLIVLGYEAGQAYKEESLIPFDKYLVSYMKFNFNSKVMPKFIGVVDTDMYDTTYYDPDELLERVKYLTQLEKTILYLFYVEGFKPKLISKLLLMEQQKVTNILNNLKVYFREFGENNERYYK